MPITGLEVDEWPQACFRHDHNETGGELRVRRAFGPTNSIEAIHVSDDVRGCILDRLGAVHDGEQLAARDAAGLRVTSADGNLRACRNVLRLVQELHVRGYQRVRICPCMAPSGLHWRCTITPVTNIRRSHGALVANDGDDPLVARYTSGQERDYFGWTDARHASPNALARMFIERFPALVEAGRGSDWTYAGWYVDMLHLTYADALPISFADWPTPDGYMTTVGPGEPRRLPLPPPGEAQQ